MAATVWHGTADEGKALSEAIKHNCGCTFGMLGVLLQTCVPHHDLQTDQRWIDGLLYARSIAGLLIDEEFEEEP